MGIMSKILGGGGNRSVDDYVELDLDDFAEAHAETGMQVHIAEIGDQGDVIPIKDAVYDGDFVIADITRHSTSDRTIEHTSSTSYGRSPERSTATSSRRATTRSSSRRPA